MERENWPKEVDRERGLQLVLPMYPDARILWLGKIGHKKTYGYVEEFAVVFKKTLTEDTYSIHGYCFMDGQATTNNTPSACGFTVVHRCQGSARLVLEKYIESLKGYQYEIVL